MSYLEHGVLKNEDILIPSEERFQKGPVAIVECVQEIPCNPCVDSCSRGAVTIKGSINNVPELDFDKCNGCGKCIADCPGLAIFLVDKTYNEQKALIGIPYEFLPLPEKGEEVTLLDRAGNICGKGKVIKIRNTKAQDRTPVVFLEVEKSLAMTARHFKKINNEN